MNAAERRVSAVLAGLFSLRMIGLFMIYPVFAVYAVSLAGATPLLIGLALGIYGLTQALLQIPFGLASDRLGRKPVIAVGLGLFVLGSALAATASTIEGVIAGRALQGAGAVGSTILALGADLTRASQRTKAMAAIGMAIGASFAVAIVLGPILNIWIGVPGLFWVTAALGCGGLLALALAVPAPPAPVRHRDAEPTPAMLRRVLADPALLRLDVGILALHTILTASFVALPTVLQNTAGLAANAQWLVYLPVLAVSAGGMVVLIAIGERAEWKKRVFVGAIATLGAAQAALAGSPPSLWIIVPALTVFFVGFNYLEASLPSLVSQAAPPGGKGAALGVYSSAQFFGVFLGGALGGWVLGHSGLGGVFVLGAVIACAWLGLSLAGPAPEGRSTYMLPVGERPERELDLLVDRLLAVPGVTEAEIAGDEGVAYLKVDRARLDEARLRELGQRQPEPP